MTWFKSLILRQNSPLLLIDSDDKQHGYTLDESPKRRWRSQNKNNLFKTNRRRSSRSRQAQVRFILANYYLESEVESQIELVIQSQQEQKATQASNRLLHLVQGVAAASRRELPTFAAPTSCQQEKYQSISNPAAAASISQQTRRTNSRSKINRCNLQGKGSQRKVELRMAKTQKLLCCWTWCFLTLTLGLIMAMVVGGIGSVKASNTLNQQYFEAQPEIQQFVQNGNDAKLRCLIRNRQGECLWLRNGLAIGAIAKKYQFNRQPEDGDCSLTIRNASVQQDDGQWQCQVTPSDVEQDTLQSRVAQLVVLVAPERPQIKNMSQSTHRVVLEENKTKFIVCEIRGGNPAPQIEWTLDNKNISKEAQSSSFVTQTQTGGAQSNQRITQSKLKMSDIKRSMNGKNLTCVGIHQTINQSTSVDLDVQYVPTVSVVQREYSIVEGSPLSISCQVDSNPPPNIVNWRLVSDGSALAGKSQQSASITQPTRPGPVLEFERISRDLNQNIFECLAQNSYGISMPADVKLNVLYAPYLLNTSHSESVVVGSQAQLACIFDGNPQPEVKWLYTDPLSRSAMAVQLDNNKQQYLDIKNVTYRNEGDYHCEARNKINGVDYGVRSSNIILDVYGEPQFLVKSPVNSKAVQGSKSELVLTFCSDPPPNKVYWQFGSLRLDVRLNNINNGQQPAQAPQTLPGGAKQSSVNQRFQVHPLQTIQRRESSFSKLPTCFEAQLSIMEPELTDQRDYTLIVQNERGHQSAFVRLRVSSPLSPVLMITSAFVTICGLFLCSLVVMFLVKKRHQSGSGGQNGSQNGDATIAREKNGVEHLVNGNRNANTTNVTAATAAVNGQLMQQQTRGIVNGSGNGVANGASNPTGGQARVGHDDAKLHMMSMASSDTSGDQKQLLANSDRNSSASLGSTTNQCVDFNVNSTNSTGNSTPTPMNHISVDDDMHLGSTYQAAESVTRDAHLSPHNSHLLNCNGALIYANLDYADHHSMGMAMAMAAAGGHLQIQHQHQHQHQHSPAQLSTLNASVAGASNHLQHTPMEHSPTDSDQQSAAAAGTVTTTTTTTMPQSNQQQRHTGSPKLGGVRSSVGATIAMMNSLAAAAAANQQTISQSPNSGVLNGAINQQLANSRQIRKPGPPKPPKPSIQQRSRFYKQQHNNDGLVMIGSPTGEPIENNYSNLVSSDAEPSANELAVEYSRIAFPARAEL